MKKYLIILSIYFTSCTTIKIEEQVVQNFVKDKNLKNIPYIGASYLIEESNSNKNILEYYKLSYLDKDSLFIKRRVLTFPRNISFWPISINEINKLMNAKDSLTYKWNLKKFNALEVPIIERNELLSQISKNILPISTTGHIISKPIFSLNKKYAFIKYSSIFSSGGSTERFYLMEKKKSKWIVKIEFAPNTDL